MSQLGAQKADASDGGPVYAGIQTGYAREDVFISHAGQQREFAVQLRRDLQRHGISAFVDERDIMLDPPSDCSVRDPCISAKLVIFVVTRQFLQSTRCLDELRWALAQREHGKGCLPEILTVLYPAGADTVSVDDLSPLDHKLLACCTDVPERQRKQQPPIPDLNNVDSQSQQHRMDLESLSTFCLMRADASSR